MQSERITASVIFAESLALKPAGSCDGCGNDAVELLVHGEDGYPDAHYCRPCASDDWWFAPDAEFITGEAI